MFRFAENLIVMNLLKPQAYTSDATTIASAYVKIDKVHWVSFLIPHGDIATAATDTLTFTVECSTAGSSNATEVQVPFRYRLAGAVATPTWGAITAVAAATGVALPGDTADEKTLIIDVDPSVLPPLLVDGLFLRVVATASTNVAGVLGGVIAVLEPRYPGNTIPTAT